MTRAIPPPACDRRDPALLPMSAHRVEKVRIRSTPNAARPRRLTRLQRLQSDRPRFLKWK